MGQFQTQIETLRASKTAINGALTDKLGDSVDVNLSGVPEKIRAIETSKDVEIQVRMLFNGTTDTNGRELEFKDSQGQVTKIKDSGITVRLEPGTYTVTTIVINTATNYLRIYEGDSEIYGREATWLGGGVLQWSDVPITKKTTRIVYTFSGMVE